MAISRNAPVTVDDANKSRSCTCPICGKSADEADRYFPFCSDRCKTIDLGNWASEKYRISRPIEHSDIDEGE